VLGSLGYHLIHHVVARYLFHDYIQQSLTSDLANIPTTYQSNGGLFLVAATHDTDHVLGMVAAEFKKEESNHTNVPVYELRRMSVDASVRGLGIGKKLLTALEDRLPTPSKIILYTSNVQYAAHRLYERQGNSKQGVEVYGKWSLGFEIWYYVKTLLE
jgi:GNAT superfamily N-acetyltransferase